MNKIIDNKKRHLLKNFLFLPPAAYLAACDSTDEQSKISSDKFPKIKLKMVTSFPKNLPDFITADISKLELGDKLYSSELKDDKYEFLHPGNTVVCQVKVARTSLKEIEEAEAEPTEETTKEATEDKK